MTGRAPSPGATDAREHQVGPPPELRFRRRLRPLTVVRELVGARQLVFTLAERDLRARYKQTVLGFAWAVITPVTLMVVFTVFFRRVARVDTGGAPYALFAYVALVPWTFFSSAVGGGAQSLVSNMSLLNKVYCPREVFPLGAVLVAAVDSTIAVTVLGALFAAYRYAPAAEAVWMPLLLAVQVAFTVGITLILSVTTVYFRDLRQGLPFVLQLALFATPVAYGFEAIPRAAWPIYAALNPLAPVIDGYRRTILLGRPPDLGLLGIAAASAAVVLVGGYALFKRREAGIADVA